ncbi:MAG: N-acetylmuramoyl-L-alanine amidase, partial [Acidobacteria bacterium]|nr:N-acetylmuramoyl-L-alanine amidase [Acidobacteriota bacterium]
TGGMGDDRELDFILWDMAQAAHLNESATLAEILQEELNGTGEEKNRGIKQAPFRVLMGATMPAVLIEVGFITNPEEERELGSSTHQNKLAQDIYRGLVRFKERYERRYGASEPDRLEAKRP